MSISLCMIVKDEEEILIKCLEHVKGIVDEFVIVDTGSTDKTKEIIAKYGPVHEIPFKDFVTTKNAAMDLATGDYILWMDADEILYQGADILKIHADEGKYTAIYTSITEGGDDYSVVGNRYDRARLWKRGTHRFVGPGVHEVVVGTGQTLRDGRILVRHEHLKTNKAATAPERYAKYIDLLQEAICTGNEVSRAWFYLARTYMDMGRHLDAISAYMEYLDIPTNCFRDEIWQAHYDMATCYKINGEHDYAIKWLNKSLEIDDRRSESHCLLGDIAFQRQDYKQAITHYNAAVRDIPVDVTLFLHPYNYFEYPKDQLVLCHYYEHDYPQALAITKELIAYHKGRNGRVSNNAWWSEKKIKSTVFMTLGLTPEPIYGGMIDHQGVGGVETTYLELSEELARQGMNVFLFCTTAEPHIYRGVYYVPYEQIDQYWNMDPDVIITSRWFDPFKKASKAKKIIWFQDAFFGIPNDYPDLFQQADAVICSSLWHHNYILERLGRGLAKEKLHIIPLGIRKDLFIQDVPRQKNTVLYSSNPDRGLEHLIDMWDRICDRIPDIKLTVTYGWEGLKTWNTDAAWHQSISRLQEKCYRKAEESGNITFTGRVTKRQVAQHMLGSSLLVYPNNFWETYCLTALEAQAAGTPIITTDMGALSTVVNRNCNILIPGSPRSARYQDLFVNGIASLYFNDKERRRWSQENREAIANMPCDWTNIGELWSSFLYRTMEG